MYYTSTKKPRPLLFCWRLGYTESSHGLSEYSTVVWSWLGNWLKKKENPSLGVTKRRGSVFHSVNPADPTAESRWHRSHRFS